MKSLCLFIGVLSIASPLHAAEVSINAAGTDLHGVLDEPDQHGALAIFILAGSGPTDRDGNTTGMPGKNHSLKYLSEALNEKGVTTLRIDKRGVGESAGAAIKESDLRFTNYVEDARQWIDFLNQRGYSEVILVGHSEGALVATLASASSDSVKGLICIAGAGRPASDLLAEQLKTQLPKEVEDQANQIIAKLAAGETVETVPPALFALFRPDVQPYLISWMQIDPADAISKVDCPVLIVQGSTDLQTEVKDAERLAAAAKKGELKIVEGMNHVLKEVDGDLAKQMPSYFNPDLPVHKELVSHSMKFIRALDPKLKADE